MSSPLTKILLLFTLIALSTQDFFDADTKVVQLNSTNFEKEVLNTSDLWLVLFYAPWCGHCKRFHPEYEKAAKGLEGIFKIGAVDATASKDLASKYEIRGYPTVKFFYPEKNNTEKYTGQRTATAISEFLIEKTKKIFNERLGIVEKKEEPKKEEPKKDEKKKEETKKEEKKKEEPKKEEKKEEVDDKDVIVLTDDNFNDQVFGSEDMWLIAFYAPWCGHCKRLLPEWNKAATKLKGKVKIAKLDCTVNKKMASEYKIDGYPTVKVFGTGKGKGKVVEEYSGTRKEDGIVQYALDKLKKFQEGGKKDKTQDL